VDCRLFAKQNGAHRSPPWARSIFRRFDYASVHAPDQYDPAREARIIGLLGAVAERGCRSFSILIPSVIFPSWEDVGDVADRETWTSATVPVRKTHGNYKRYSVICRRRCLASDIGIAAGGPTMSDSIPSFFERISSQAKTAHVKRSE